MDSIIPNRTQISDRFPIASFTIRVPEERYFEVACATDPGLFHTAKQSLRNPHNFFTSRGRGLLRAAVAGTTYLLPSEQLQQFAGSRRIYYALATYGSPRGTDARFTVHPQALNHAPSIALASDFTGRALDRARIGKPRSDGRYGAPEQRLTWGGDEAMAAQAAAARAAAPGYGGYDDGFGAALWEEDAHECYDDEDEGLGAASLGAANARRHGTPARALDDNPAMAPEYPQASLFAEAAHFRRHAGRRRVDRIVIHITDGRDKTERLADGDGHELRGGPMVPATVNGFRRRQTDSKKQKSAHYVVGRQGEVVQMVRNNDIAWHAKPANTHTIGIEHVARAPGEGNRRGHVWREYRSARDPGLFPTMAQYCASAALVRWLCEQYGLPLDRDHIQGHSEAAPQTTHKDCPNAVWDWDTFMAIVRSGACPAPRSEGQEAQDDADYDGDEDDHSVRWDDESDDAEGSDATIGGAASFDDGEPTPPDEPADAMFGDPSDADEELDMEPEPPPEPGGLDLSAFDGGSGDDGFEEHSEAYGGRRRASAKRYGRSAAHRGRTASDRADGSSACGCGAQQQEADAPPAVTAGIELGVRAKIEDIVEAVAQAESGDRRDLAKYSAVASNAAQADPRDRTYGQRRAGLSWGLIKFGQRSGSLGKVLRRFRDRSETEFARAFGSAADELLQITSAPSPDERLRHVAGRALWDPSWISRFEDAGRSNACRAAQREVAVTEHLDPNLRAAADLGLVTDRAIAMLYDRCIDMGNEAGVAWVTRHAGPIQTREDLAAALEALGVDDIAAFQETVQGLEVNGELDTETHGALADALRRLGPASLVPAPSVPQMLDRLVDASRGTRFHGRLRALRASPELRDVTYDLSACSG